MEQKMEFAALIAQHVQEDSKAQTVAVKPTAVGSSLSLFVVLVF
jgi:hypothetical protein